MQEIEIFEDAPLGPPSSPEFPAGPASPVTGTLTGRVTWVDRNMENCDFNWYRFLSKTILFLMIAPLLAGLFVACLILSMVLAVFGLRGPSQIFSPFHFANTFFSLAVIFPRSSPKQVPVVRLTIQGHEGERAALVKGELICGAFRRGDEIELQGTWKNGTLMVKEGYNHTLGTSVLVRTDRWRFVFLGLMGLIVLVIILVLVNAR